MSGAEAAGLAVGVITLASLFKTCVELLEWFELGRNLTYDYDLACTKVNILHKRLSLWGSATHIQEPSREDPFLKESRNRDVVASGLLKLRDILSDTDGLRKKYDLAPAKPTVINSKKRGSTHKLASWSLNLRRRTTWSIRDKAKFDRFVADISFLIENIEKVTQRGENKIMSGQGSEGSRADAGPFHNQDVFRTNTEGTALAYSGIIDAPPVNSTRSAVFESNHKDPFSAFSGRATAEGICQIMKTAGDHTLQRKAQGQPEHLAEQEEHLAEAEQALREASNRRNQPLSQNETANIRDRTQEAPLDNLKGIGERERHRY